MSNNTPDWMEQRAKKLEAAGGQSAYEAKKFVEMASKIKPNQWKLMTENLSVAKEFIEKSTVGSLSEMANSITDTIDLKMQELFAPITNEINSAINKALAPFMTAIAPVINNLGLFLVNIMNWDWWARQGEIAGKAYYESRRDLGLKGKIQLYKWYNENIGGSFAEFLIWIEDYERKTSGGSSYDPYERTPGGRVIY